tara:strand:- start:56 stop:727 length:672 start_codon:yes stop_codon:yes gene_type:complete
MNITNKFWGEYDSSIIFCEDKYVESMYIAEFWNTISGLLYVCVGLYFMNTFVKNIGISLVVMGIGTIGLHGTLRWYGQWMDEMGMLALLFTMIKYAYYDMSNYILYLILVTYMVFNNNHNIFLLMFVVLLFYQYKSSDKIIRNQVGLDYRKYYFICMIFGSICWGLDRLCFTKIINFHMYWHIFSAIGSLFGTFVFYEYNKQLYKAGNKIKHWYRKKRKLKNL